MHGVAKTKVNDVQKEVQQKKREKKLALYITARDIISEKMRKGNYDDDGLKISGNVLTKNPDVYTFWNYRKRTLFKTKQIASTSVSEDDDKAKIAVDIKNLVKGELELTETCLHENPKSYGAWHHRFWVVKTFGIVNIDTKAEIGKCEQLLTLDERNFHCWDYWRSLCTLAGIPNEKQLEFCDSKVKKNFSNYSAWHYRSTLLPLLYPDSNNPNQIDKATLEKELKLVLNAVFTDPEDQSAFFYRNWLLDSLENAKNNMPNRLLKVQLNLKPMPKLILNFKNPIALKSVDIKLKLDGNEFNFDASFKLITFDGSRYSEIWTCNHENFSVLKDTSELEVLIVSHDQTWKLRRQDQNLETLELSWISDNSNNEAPLTIPDQKWFFDLLKSDAASLRELIEMEPDQKWPLISLMLTLKRISFKENRKEILGSLEKLIELDPARRNYYLHLIEAWNNDCDTI